MPLPFFWILDLLVSYGIKYAKKTSILHAFNPKQKLLQITACNKNMGQKFKKRGTALVLYVFKDLKTTSDCF